CLNQAISDSAFPGCAISVGYRGKLIFEQSFGTFTYEPQSPKIEVNSIFDLASVTKVVATTTTTMILYDQGRLQLDWKVIDIIPAFQGKDKEKVTIRHLLTHTSGLPGWIRFYLELNGKERIIQEICDTELENEPGTTYVYSDLGMIMMQKILETIAQKPLDQLVLDYISIPLYMKRTIYNPDSSLINEIVPTEISEWHKKLVHGFVHDENTYVMGGISGHAGLFSTVQDLSVFCQMYLNRGLYDNKRILKTETIELFTTRQNLIEGSTRALGWDTRSEQNSMAGDFMSMRAFGHSGFTGTTIWIDPENQVFVVLLSNRVYPTRENRKISRVRPIVHNYVMKTILDLEH
ncbi:MAG: serine hydrolase, partial [Calditrichia bacterium]|nr:serine hydrolase [Calditrichia bacterium]